jgi:5-hydroxyisourate hydrolase-like protein (transthyretin family)
MKERWLLAGIASCALTACFPARLTEQPGFIVEVRDRSTGVTLTDAKVHFAKVKIALAPQIELREFQTDADGRVRFDRKTEWQLVLGLPEANYSWAWFMCVDKEGYLPFVNNLVEAKPPARVLVELKKSKGAERCAWHAPRPLGFNLPGLTASIR